MPDWRNEAGRWWTGLLRQPAGAMRGGVFAADHLDHVGVVRVTGAPGPVVYGPGPVLPTVAAVVARADGDLAELGRDLAVALGPRAGRLLGPAWYGYVSADLLRTPPAGTPDQGTVRALSQADLPLLARLHEQTPPAEVTESGTDGRPAFGYVERAGAPGRPAGDAALLAVACLGSWQEMPTIGVLTHPRARRRGLAPRVVAAAAAAGLNHRAVVQYRAFSTNTDSISVAERSGFAHYCDALVINLTGQRAS